MNEKLNSNNNEDNDNNKNTDEIEYKHLIIRLKKISSTIALLEKTIFR